jgi:hypothetical protein
MLTFLFAGFQLTTELNYDWTLFLTVSSIELTLNWTNLSRTGHLSLILRPTVSRHPSGAYGHIFNTVRQWRVCWCRALFLRGRVSFTIAAGPRQSSHFGSQSRGTRLRFETSLFVASYDSQGYGGGIRPRLHKGMNCQLLLSSRYIASGQTTAQKTHPCLAMDTCKPT